MSLRLVHVQRRRLVLLAATQALMWSGAALFTCLVIGTWADVPILQNGAWPVGVATLGALLWRVRFIWSPMRVALWLEERIPELRYALVTANDPCYRAALEPLIEPLIPRDRLTQVTRRAMAYSALPGLLAFTFGSIAFFYAPGRQHTAHGKAVGSIRTVTELNRLEALVARVTPPRYAVAAGHESQTFEQPTTIAALPGSNVEIIGNGTPDRIVIRLGDSALTTTAERARSVKWRAAFTLPDTATALRLEDGAYHRLIVLAPVRDGPPTVQLILPARDTTVRAPTGSVDLETRLTDDIALERARFEYIVATGEGEGSFAFREGVVGARRFGPEVIRSARHRITVPLRVFDLKPGDQLTVRAVAVDGNQWNGPGIGYSEPRTLRVARPGEYDSLAVEPAPPPADSMLMTLRWLIQLVERLDASRTKLTRQMFVDSSRALGTRAERIRDRIQQLQSDYTMAGRLPPNPLLASAYLGLVEGASDLKIALPGESLPHLYEALRALQQYAWSERYYPHGRAAAVLVDLARVRLTGADPGRASGRTGRSLADTARFRLRQSYAVALTMLATAPDDARDRLALLQIEALRAEPALAAALATALDALQAGRDPAPALQRARRILEGPLSITNTLPHWSGAW
jgi:hypothetical protein